jgi:hypothetical protein
MSEHAWKTSEDLDYWGDHYDVCGVCDVHRVDNDRYAIRHFDRPQRPIPPKYGVYVYCSMDCGIAQEQILFYVLGVLRTAQEFDDIRFGQAPQIIASIEERIAPRSASNPRPGPPRASFKNIMAAYELLEKACQWPEDLRRALAGEFLPVSGEPPLEIEL